MVAKKRVEKQLLGEPPGHGTRPKPRLYTLQVFLIGGPVILYLVEVPAIAGEEPSSGRTPVAMISLVGAATAADGLIASPDPDWPQWRGPRRDGISDEKGLLPSWPEGGPKLLWKVDGLGRGWSSPIVVGRRQRLAYMISRGLVTRVVNA